MVLALEKINEAVALKMKQLENNRAQLVREAEAVAKSKKDNLKLKKKKLIELDKENPTSLSEAEQLWSDQMLNDSNERDIEFLMATENWGVNLIGSLVIASSNNTNKKPQPKTEYKCNNAAARSKPEIKPVRIQDLPLQSRPLSMATEK